MSWRAMRVKSFTRSAARVFLPRVVEAPGGFCLPVPARTAPSARAARDGGGE